jgi:micrococcal nuclease
VIDGDTIRVKPLERTRRRAYKVRLIGIDTPETKKPATPVECGGKEATDSMLDVSFTAPRDTDGDGLFDKRGGRGARVTLKTDTTQSRFDRYGRLLAYAKRRDGRTLAGIQLKRGWAKVYVFRKRFRLYRQFQRIQAGARDAERGVWGLCGGHFHRPA